MIDQLMIEPLIKHMPKPLIKPMTMPYNQQVYDHQAYDQQSNL
jgi:hypothetical protein